MEFVTFVISRILTLYGDRQELMIDMNTAAHLVGFFVCLVFFRSFGVKVEFFLSTTTQTVNMGL